MGIVNSLNRTPWRLAIGCSLVAFGLGFQLSTTLRTRFDLQPADTVNIGQATPVQGGASSHLVLDVVDLGVVRSGGRTLAIVWLRNSSPGTVAIVSLKTTCHCLAVHLLEKLVPAHGKVPVLIEFDGSQEIDFAGNLGIRVSAILGDGDAVDVGTVCVEVNNDQKVHAISSLSTDFSYLQ